MEGIGEGIKSMVHHPDLACTIGALCQDYLGTGAYVGHLVQASNMPQGLIPAMVFLIAAGLSFSIGMRGEPSESSFRSSCSSARRLRRS